MTKYKLRYSFLISLTILSFFNSSCTRYSNNETQPELIDENASITILEVDKIANLKVNLVNYSEPNKYSIAIPDYYQATTSEYGKGEIDIQFGNLNFGLKEKIYEIDLKSALTIDDGFVDESVSIVPENNPNLLTLKDIKSDIEKAAIESNEEPFIYYEDSNSIIYGEDLKVFHFEYDLNTKSYVIYIAELNHFKEISQKEKFNFAMHLLKNAKNLLKKNYIATTFNSWEEFVANTSYVEVNYITKPYSVVNKEMKVFMNTKDQIYVYEGTNRTVFYRANPAMDLAFLNFTDAIKSNKVAAFDLQDEIHDDFERIFFDYDPEFSYSISQIENVFIVKYKDPDYEKASEKLICAIDYKGKSFYLVMNNEFVPATKDFYIKMLNYYSKNKTLEIPSKK